MCYVVNNLDIILYLCTKVSANRHNMALLRQVFEPQWRCRYDFCGIIIALVLYSVLSKNLATSTDIYTT